MKEVLNFYGDLFDSGENTEEMVLLALAKEARMQVTPIKALKQVQVMVSRRNKTIQEQLFELLGTPVPST